MFYCKLHTNKLTNIFFVARAEGATFMPRTASSGPEKSGYA
jgi:hypothetical protein